MPEIPGWISAIISGLTVLVVGIWLNGRRDRDRAIDSRLSVLEKAVGSKELATSGDFDQLDRRLENVEKTLGEIQVLLGRMDERWKLTHGE